MQHRENDEFADVVLLVAIVLYIFIAAALYAGLAVREPDLVAAMGAWAKDYGSILAGIPVLVAVWFAKQQLEANRRQHVANIKRSFRKELEALEEITSYARHVIASEERVARASDASQLSEHMPYPYVDVKSPRRWYEVVPSSLLEIFQETQSRTRPAVELIVSSQPDLILIRKRFASAAIWAKKLEKDAQAELDRLSQYWS